MRKINNDHLSNDASPQEISEWIDAHPEQFEFQAKKKLSDEERGKIRRNIEDIKERKSLRDFLGDDYDLLDS